MAKSKEKIKARRGKVETDVWRLLFRRNKMYDPQQEGNKRKWEGCVLQFMKFRTKPKTRLPGSV